jgi:ParB-like chromosome segregation protein Spo0J
VAAAVKLAFERQLVVVRLDEILPTRQVTPRIKKMVKYRRIEQSIREIGVIEPLAVARPAGEDRYMLLDGHIRYAVLQELGETETRCLLARDDEGFTYNKRINRLATIQEHYMIVRALDRGVSEEKIARALNVDVKSIRRRRSLLDGVCPEVVELLKDRSVNPVTFEVLRRMKPVRQIEVAELLLAANNFTSSYAKALLAATHQTDLMHPDKPKKVGGMTPEQMARMEREMASLNQDFKALEASYGDDVLHLVIASGYLARLIGNPEIERFLQSRHPEILGEFRAIITAASLDQTSLAPSGV